MYPLLRVAGVLNGWSSVFESDCAQERFRIFGIIRNNWLIFINSDMLNPAQRVLCRFADF